MSRLSTFASAIALSLVTSAAAASTVSLTYHGASSGSDAKAVTIQSAPPDYPGTGDWPKTVGAFGFNMKDSTPGGLGDFIAWCLDVGSFLSASSSTARPYTITSDPFSNSYGLSAAEQERVQDLFDANYETLDTASGNEAAGFQIALWDAIYDGDNDLSAGAFKVSASTAILNAASAFQTAASGYLGNKKFNVSFLESDDTGSNGKYQNLVTVAPVPIPAAGGMLLLALGGLFAARRSKRG